jgi:hypothetical protein
MRDLVVDHPRHIAAMSETAIDQVARLEAASLQRPQVLIRTGHVLHAGVYARTVLVPAGVLITGVLVTIPTLLIVCGHATVFVDGGPVELQGYHVVTAEAYRKQAFVAHADTHLTMIFATDAATVEEAEAEFTDEVEMLQSRQEAACPA